MILDKMTELVTTVALDLEAVRPGPGEPIKLFSTGNAASEDIVVTTCATEGGVYTACVTAECDLTGDVEFALPSSTLGFIKATFTGRTFVTLSGNQTNQ